MTAALAAGLVTAHLLGVDVSTLTRDTTSVAELEPWNGSLSLLGVMAMAAGAGACGVAGFALRGQGERRRGDFLLATGGLVGLISLDDGLLLHEGIGPHYVGIPEPVMYALLLLAGATWLVLFRTEIARSELGLLVAGGGCLGLSLASDVSGVVPGPVEDGLKLAGIVGLVAWALWLCVEQLLAAARDTPGRPGPPDPTYARAVGSSATTASAASDVVAARSPSDRRS